MTEQNPQLDCKLCSTQAIRLPKVVKWQTNLHLKSKLNTGKPILKPHAFYFCPRCDLNRPDLDLSKR